MIRIMDSDVINQTGVVQRAFKNSKVGTISGDGFQRKAFSYLEEKINRKYPYEVKLPKSIPEMLEGDFEPSKVITIEKPIEGPFSHVWFGDSTSGVKLLCGYINGDSRYVFDQELGDAVVHGVMVGATGQGKSVTLNSIIYNACSLYAPWELHLTLSDAKIVEFKSIAQNNPMPQIEIVAATGDVDYLLSVLEYKSAEMNLLNSVFNAAQNKFGQPVKKIADFRKVTGLSLPQNLLIFDEFQAMFQKAKKLSGRIVAALDAFARLGRNTGYHLLLTSQELGTDLPKEMLSNITFRAAMGCDPNVSEMILGNDKAALNKGRKGHMIANMNSTAKNNEDLNIQVTVPFIDPQTSEIAKVQIEKGKEFGVTPKLQFYDEFDVERFSTFKDSLEKLPVDSKTIYLGEPSFVMMSDVKRLTIDLSNTEAQRNIIVVSPIQKDLIRHFVMFKLNALHMPNSSNLVMCMSKSFIEAGAYELTDKLLFEDKSFESSQTLAIARSLIYRRMLCLRADKFVFDPNREDVDLTESDKIFYMLFEFGSEYDNMTNRLRLFYMKNILNTDAVIAAGFGNMNDEAKLNILAASIETFKAYNSIDSCLVISKVPDLNVWLLGLDKLLGIGVDPKSRNINALKTLMFDATSVNVRFTTIVSTMDEIGDLTSMTHWFIFDNPMRGDISKAKVSDYYPEQVGSNLAVFFDKQKPIEGCRKFKKLYYEDEIVLG